MKILDAEAMRAVADYPALVEWLREQHRRPVGAIEDLLMSQPAPGGGDDSLLVRAAWQPGAALGVKLVTLFPGNLGGALPTVQGAYVLFDGRDGRAAAILDGTELTYWKTAADSALGAVLLARADAAELVVAGAGALAPHLLRAHCALLPSIRRVRVWNRTPARAAALAAGVPVHGPRVEAVTDLEAAVREADVVCCATATEQPIMRGEWLKPGAHLDLVGGYTPAMREADDEAVRRARVFVDARATTVEACGDIAAPIASGVLDPARIEGDLHDLCGDGPPPPRAPADVTLYKNGGGGHLDLMTARWFLDRLA